MKNRIAARSVHTLLFMLAALLFGGGLRAQITYDNFLPKSQIMPGALLTVSDPDSTLTGAGIFVNRTQYVSLVYTTEAYTDVQNYTAWSYGVVVKIMNGADTSQYFTDTLDIRRNDSLPQYQALNHYTLPWYSLHIRVLSVCGKTGMDSTCISNPHLYPLLPEDIELQAAIIRTQINGFSALVDIPTGPVQYDEGAVEEDCMERYNNRLANLHNQYDALAAQRLQDYMGTLGHSVQEMEDLETDIREGTEQRLQNLTELITDVGIDYHNQCDSVPMDTELQAYFKSLTLDVFIEHAIDPYWVWFNGACRQMYLGNTGYSQALLADGTAYTNSVFAGFDFWGATMHNEIWVLYPSSVEDCVMEHFSESGSTFMDPAITIIGHMYAVRDSLLDDAGVQDSIYMLYQGAKLDIAIQTNNEYRAAVNALNDEMLILCGYNGEYMGDCHSYYTQLISDNKDYIAALMDSVADTLETLYGLPNGLIGNGNPAITLAINGLLTEYNATLHALDQQWLTCASDSAQADSMMDVLTPISISSNYVASLFLASRLRTIELQYQNTTTLPTLGQWEILTASLIDSYISAGKDLPWTKRAAISKKWPALDACIETIQTSQNNAWGDAVEDLLSKIDSTFDTLNVYGTATSYSAEIAMGRWEYDYENDPAYQAALAKQDSLLEEKNTKCGSGSTPPTESYMACLARTEADLRNLQNLRNMHLASFDSLTQGFRGIIHPGGWNNANGNILSLLDPLLGEYTYRSDSLVIAVIAPCITDPTQHQTFMDLGIYDPQWESFMFQEDFMPGYRNLLNFQFQQDPFDELALLFDSLSQEIGSQYADYLGHRLGQKFFDTGLSTWPLDSVQRACVDSATAVGTLQFTGLVGDFMDEIHPYLEAGAVGITADSVGYRESVVYHSFLNALMDNFYRQEFENIDAQRRLCNAKLENVEQGENEIPEPPTPSVEAEIAACQSEVGQKVTKLMDRFEGVDEILLQRVFGQEMAGGMNMAPLDVVLLDSMSFLMHRAAGRVDSLWMACNGNPAVLGLLAVMHETDIALEVIIQDPPVYAITPGMLYLNGNTDIPDYSHVAELDSMDSVYYMALAHNRVPWMINYIQANAGTYGVADSCLIHHETDSLTNAQYLASVNEWKTGMQNYLESFGALYDSTVIDPDTLLMKLRWLQAAQLRERYLMITQWIALQQEYADCENLRNELIVWKAERDPSLNQPKKGIVNRYPIKPVGKFPQVPVSNGIMGLTTSTVTVVTEEGSCGNIRYLEWAPIAQAVEYDLEWAYVDNMVYLEGQPANEHAEILYRAFSLSEPIRVTVKENRFPFPGEYPAGKLYFRVRGVARVIDTEHQSFYQPQFFPWIYNWTGYAVSSADVNFNASNPFNDEFENNLNWQWEASFAEEGKFKRVISYHDGLNRPRQVVTHLSTDNLSVIGETLYDHEGRAAVQVLPYPEPCYELSYRHQTRADSLGGAFDKEDFELTAGNERMATSLGASQYYSAQNPFMAVENPLMHTGSIPDAGKYPYTQTAFLLDNTGRPTRSGGVGETHTLGGEHATRYYYANASETELRRLFGKNVGLASHYKKNAVMDANGQLSIAYVDQEGRSVATALAGLSPDNVLPLESNQPYVTTQNLTENNIHDPVNGEWNIHYTQLNEIPGNEYTFNYVYGLDHLFEEGTPPCLVCEFDLEVYVTDPDGNRLPLTEITDNGDAVATTNTFYKRLNAAGYELANPCSSLSAPRYLNFTVTLPEVNTYTIHKKLRWDKEASLAALWAASQPGVNTYTASVQTIILNSYISQINYDECEQMFPGTGFGAIPNDVLDDTDELATTSQCESYLNQMVNQIEPYQGLGNSPIPNAGYYVAVGTQPALDFWEDVRELIQAGITDPNDPGAIPPSAVAYYAGLNANAQQITDNIKADMNNWTWELKRELAKAHPEYCWYQKCLHFAQTVPYDMAMTEQTNLINGQPYRNPMGQSGSVSPFTNSGSIIYDSPLKEDDEIRPVIADKAANTPNGSIWEAAADIVSNNLSNSELNTGELAWQTFRGGYLQAKSDAFYTETDGCPFLDDENLAVVVAPPDLPEDEEGMDNANTAAQNAWEAQEPCEDICAENAEAWTAQLFANCGETGTTTQLNIYNTNKNVIKERLIAYCMNQCGGSNPMGIITEEMFAAAMLSSPGDPKYPLRDAIEIFNQTFANVEGCDMIEGTTVIHEPETTVVWNVPFTYGEGEYTEICETWGVATGPQDLLDWATRINTAYDDMDGDPDNLFLIPYFQSNSMSVIQASCTVHQQIGAASYIPLTVQPCAALNQARGCNIKFSNESGNILPQNVRHITITPTAAANATYDSFGNITVDAILEIWSIGVTGTNYSYQSFLGSSNGTMTITMETCCNNTTCRIFPNGWTEELDTDSLIEDCEQFLLEEAHQNAANAFDEWLENYVNDLWEQAQCQIGEDLRCTYSKSEYHYTLYYYDQAANLVQTVPPQGVHPLDVSNTAHFSTLGHWVNGANPPHDMESRYKFNSLEVAIESETPDGGLTLYKPDDKGRPMESRNAEQRKRAAVPGDADDIYSRTFYDELGRITSVMEIQNGGSLPFRQNHSSAH